MLETMHENDLFDMFSEISYPCSDTCYIAFCTTIIQCFAQIKNLSPQHMGQQRVCNITIIERAYATSVVNNDIDRINEIFRRRNGRYSYFF